MSTLSSSSLTLKTGFPLSTRRPTERSVERHVVFLRMESIYWSIPARHIADSWPLTTCPYIMGDS